MIKLYHLPKTRSVRIIWLLEELGLDYEVEVLTADTKSAPAFLQISPLSKVPAIEDGDLVLTESVAIVQYVLSEYGQGRLHPPADSKEYAQFLQWLNFGEATLMQPITEVIVNKLFRPEEHKHQFSIEQGTQIFADMARVIDSVLVNSDYLVGDDFTAADIVNGYSLNIADMLGLISAIDGVEHLRGYIDRLRSREAFKKIADYN
jgi:glutathione S-transferase